MTTKCYCESCAPPDQVKRTYSLAWMKECSTRADQRARYQAAKIESEKQASRMPAAKPEDLPGWWNKEGSQTA